MSLDDLVLFKKSALSEDNFEFNNYLGLNKSLYTRGDERLVVQEDVKGWLRVEDCFKRYNAFGADHSRGVVGLQLDLFETSYHVDDERWYL